MILRSFFFIILSVTAVSLFPQTPDASPFLFNDYQNALIFYKDGRQFQAPVNFNLLEGHYLFIDAKDKEAKQFSNPELIALLRIGEQVMALQQIEIDRGLELSSVLIEYQRILIVIEKEMGSIRSLCKSLMHKTRNQGKNDQKSFHKL